MTPQDLSNEEEVVCSTYFIHPTQISAINMVSNQNGIQAHGRLVHDPRLEVRHFLFHRKAYLADTFDRGGATLNLKNWVALKGL